MCFNCFGLKYTVLNKYKWIIQYWIQSACNNVFYFRHCTVGADKKNFNVISTTQRNIQNQSINIFLILRNKICEHFKPKLIYQPWAVPALHAAPRRTRYVSYTLCHLIIQQLLYLPRGGPRPAAGQTADTTLAIDKLSFEQTCKLNILLIETWTIH